MRRTCQLKKWGLPSLPQIHYSSWHPAQVTKDGRIRAPRFKLAHERNRDKIYRVPIFMQLAFVGGVIYFVNDQYERFSHVTPQQRFLQKMEVQPYGVMGDRMKGSQTLVPFGSPPDKDTTIVDLTNLKVVKNNVLRASGASKTVYNFLGVHDKLPSAVADALWKPTDAKLHRYSRSNGEQPVIHCVTPDFRKGLWSKREAALELSRAYRNILHEFVLSDTNTLRVAPVGSGIQSGTLHDEMAVLTHEAMSVAFEQLHPFDQKALIDDQRHIEVCIFSELEYEKYVVAFDHLTPPNPLIT